ncbi:MAG: NAD(P)/FAD-dependent oxidoreductase [Lacipirellulaceae bacterium]
MHRDFVIVGGGLAGCALAWTLRWRGAGVLVIDRGGPCASRVAAGLVTPITGKRLTVNWRWDDFWPAAQGLYRRAAAELGLDLWREAPAVRLLASADERGLFDRRQAEPGFGACLAALDPPLDAQSLYAAEGAFAMRASRLDVVALIDATRGVLRQRGDWIDATIDPLRDVDRSAPGPLRLPALGATASRVVWCVGHTTLGPSWLDAAPWAPAKGEVLTIRVPDLCESRVLHRGVWLAPSLGGEPGVYDVGATHAWSKLDERPTDAARDELLGKLRAFVRSPIEVLDHRVGVRPALADRKPIAGWRPDDPREGVLGGLGGKGVLWAPKVAEGLARSVLDATPIDPDFDFARR